MPCRSKRRQSLAHVYETTPNVRQKHFPSVKQTVRSKASECSSTGKRQQTITQMNPFNTIFHPDPNQENINYYDDAKDILGEPEQPERASKRRRVSPGNTPVPRMTRSGKKRITASAPAASHKAGHIDKAEDDLLPKSEDAALMPPPKTPKPKRQREIPSSQSPADSPISTSSLRSQRAISRSPLKEKSRNISLQTFSSKSVRWRGKREIPDSMENTVDRGSLSSDGNLETIATSCFKGLDGNGLRDPARIRGLDEKDENELEIRSSVGYNVQPSRKTEIFDSEEENACSSDSMQFGETQRALTTKDTYSSQDAEDDDFLRTEVKLPKLPVRHGSVPSNASGPNRSTQHVSTRATEDVTESSIPLDEVESKGFLNVPTLPQHPTESQEASHQLIDDLRRATQPHPGVETESQFENAWQSYQCRPAEEPKPESPVQYVRSSQAEGIEGVVQELMTVPTQPLERPHADGFVKPSRLPVAPSQATTIDVTQFSARGGPLHSSPALHSSPMPPQSTSPTASPQETDPWAPGYEWEGGKLRDSQLLPASLMEDSLVAPPDAWDMEQELEPD
ncbi:MAG: hypothetical protein Q9163_002533 [Psora crenata]